MKDYLIKFNGDGRRGTTYAAGVHYFVDQNSAAVDGSVKVQDLLADGYVFVDQADYNNLLGNNDEKKEYCRHSDGTFAPYVALEPTAEEKAAAKRAQIDSDYNASVAELQASMQIAQLNNDTDAIASVRAEKVDLDAAYKNAVAGVEGSDK